MNFADVETGKETFGPCHQNIDRYAPYRQQHQGPEQIQYWRQDNAEPYFAFDQRPGTDAKSRNPKPPPHNQMVKHFEQIMENI